MVITQNAVAFDGETIAVDDGYLMGACRDWYDPTEIWQEDELVERVVEKYPKRVLQEYEPIDLLERVDDEAIIEDVLTRDLLDPTDHREAQYIAEKVESALPYLTDRELDELTEKIDRMREHRGLKPRTEKVIQAVRFVLRDLDDLTTEYDECWKKCGDMYAQGVSEGIDLAAVKIQDLVKELKGGNL